MGNLYGSEYWTYLLPKRVNADTARFITQELRLPISAQRAKKIGLIDYTFNPDLSVKQQVKDYANDPNITVLRNSSSVQAVKENKLNMIGVNFFTDTLQNVDFITANKKSSIISLGKQINTKLINRLLIESKELIAQLVYKKVITAFKSLSDNIILPLVWDFVSKITSFFDSSCAIFFFSQSRQAAKRFFFAPSRLCEATLHFFASLRLCAITPFLKNSLKGYLQSELFHF